MSKGPLGVRWGDWTLDGPQAGAVSLARVELENAGSVPWRDGIFLAYHWLDGHGNPIVWDGERTMLPVVAPGERVVVDARVRAPIPPGRYRLAFDVVAEFRAWFSELGSETRAADLEVRPRRGSFSAELPPWVEPAPDWAERVAAAHAEGYGVVSGTIEWIGGLGRRRPRRSRRTRRDRGACPGFSHPLLCPSVMDGITLDPLGDVAGLPAFAAPLVEPWLYDGRLVLRARPRSR